MLSPSKIKRLEIFLSIMWLDPVAQLCTAFPMTSGPPWNWRICAFVNTGILNLIQPGTNL